MGSPPPESPTRRRTVRSFVTRAGRLTGAQERALTELWPRFGVEFSAARLDLPALYGNERPCTVEIGFGNGEHLAARAQAEPHRNFLGIEVYRPGLGSLLRTAHAAALGNLRVIAHDAVEVLSEQIAPDALDEVAILFPDPWPKKRHHKRRLVQAQFVQLAATRLREGGRMVLATDWEPYAEQMQSVLDACPLLEKSDESGATSRAPTRFERRGTSLGLTVHEFLYLRRLSHRISEAGP